MKNIINVDPTLRTVFDTHFDTAVKNCCGVEIRFCLPRRLTIVRAITIVILWCGRLFMGRDELQSEVQIAPVIQPIGRVNVEPALLLKSLKNVLITDNLAHIYSLCFRVDLVDLELGRTLVGDRIHKPQLYATALGSNDQLIDQIISNLLIDLAVIGGDIEKLLNILRTENRHFVVNSVVLSK